MGYWLFILVNAVLGVGSSLLVAAAALNFPPLRPLLGIRPRGAKVVRHRPATEGPAD